MLSKQYKTSLLGWLVSLTDAPRFLLCELKMIIFIIASQRKVTSDLCGLHYVSDLWV